MQRAIGYAEFGEERPRQYWATIAIVAASAASAASAGYQASQAGGPGSRAPRFVTPPEPASERALRHYTARLLAQGAASVPPSFLDFVASGGKATFDLGDTRMTPGESRAIGQFDPKGRPWNWVEPGQQQLTLDQLLYLAHAPKGGFGSTPGIRKAGMQYHKLQTLEDKPQTPHRQKREEKLRGKLEKTGFGPYV